MKKVILLGLIFCGVFFCFNKAYAAENQIKLPTRFTYAKEWINIHFLTLRNSSKVKLLDRYATARADNIKTAADIGQSEKINELVKRYTSLKETANKILEQKSIADKTTLIETIKTNTLAQQKILSVVRQNISDENIKTSLASTQESVVNRTKDLISETTDAQSASDFADQVVVAWRDPVGTVNDEKATRVYAAGTTESSNTNDGIIIDQGEAKISQDDSGNLKIEYAPGTGPSSTVADNGKRIWKIEMSDGTTVDSYTVASKVVVGGSTGTASNIIVNTVSGGTSTSAQTVAGGNTGTATVIIVGGKPGVATAGMESGGAAADPGQTIINSTNSTNSTSGGSSGQSVAPATP